MWYVVQLCFGLFDRGGSQFIWYSSVESFYNVKYGSSVITSKVSQKISVMGFLLSSRQNMIKIQKQTIFLETPFFFVFITENG